MWAAFKLLPGVVKIGIILGFLVALAGIIGGAYYGGYTKGSARADQEISEFQAKAKANQQVLTETVNTINERVLTKYLTDTQYVDRVVYKNVEVVKEVVPEQYQLSYGWVYSYNQSTANLPIDPAQASNANPSPVTDRRALTTLLGNNAKFQQNSDQIVALQTYIVELRKTIETLNNCKLADRSKCLPAAGDTARSVNPDSAATGSDNGTTP
jgi:hypothetical protein